MFYLSPKALKNLFGLERNSEIEGALANIRGQRFNIKGTVKGRKEIVGKKWTTLSRVSITK